MSTVLFPRLLSSRQKDKRTSHLMNQRPLVSFKFILAICPCVQLTFTALFSRASYTLSKQILDNFNDNIPSSQRRLLQPS